MLRARINDSGRIQCIPEGNVIVTVECDDPKCASIVSFLETVILRAIWYPATVATNSYMQKKHLMAASKETATEEDFVAWIPFALHDFGARGVSSDTSAELGGLGHLFNFLGTDNVEAAIFAEEVYGISEGCAGYSIVATEHSVMTARGCNGEFDVMERTLTQYWDAKIIACVNDSYSMKKHIEYLGTKMKQRILDWGGRWVTRPDSGDPVESVLFCLNELKKYFGGIENEKGYWVLPNCVRVIQGDGIDEAKLIEVLEAIKTAGFCVTNVVFGSGGGLLQKVDRDILQFAMKCCYIEVEGTGIEVYKQPETDMTKQSKRGRLSLYQDMFGIMKTYSDNELATHRALGEEWTEVLVPVYGDKVQAVSYSLDEIRANTGLW